MAYKDPERRREYHREYVRKRREDPKYREKENARHRQWEEDNKEHMKEWRANWRKENDESIRAYWRKYSKRGRTFMSKYKQEHGCAICGETNPVVLQFHHRDPEEKEYTVTNMSTLSIELISKEIEKCDVLCANCHLIVHYKLDKEIEIKDL